jgi:hypothetical protein
MRVLQLILIAICCLLQVACGTYIPSQRDWPNGSAREVADMNATLVRSIVCELSYAVTLSIENDLEQAKHRGNHRAYSSFLADWGVEVATDLTATEMSNVNPSGIWAPSPPISPVFTLSGGIGVGAEATNENQYNTFYPISALYKPQIFQLNSETRPCRDPRQNKEGSPLVDIDLRILPLLESRIQLVQLNLADTPSDTNVVKGEKNVLTQTVSIKESVSGDITPSWKFTTGSIDPSGSLLSASRTRTHQVVFTFGPLANNGQSLTPLAEDFHLNQQLVAGLRGFRPTR